VHLGLVLDMASGGFGERVAVTESGEDTTFAGLTALSWAASASIADLGVPSVMYIGTNHVAYPVALFGAAGAGVPLIPLNYRLGPDQLTAQIEANPGALLIYERQRPLAADPARSVERDAFVASLAGVEVDEPVPADPDLPCVLLYTSGTTSAPKAAVLRHRHLMAYLLGTVEFGNAEEDEAALVCVPPYHVAGLMNLLSNLYAGRRIVYLEGFDAETWLATVRQQRITQAMVIPTMLARIVDVLGGAADAGTPTLRSLSYGGSRMPTPVLRRALELFGDTGFVNAYGLTETSSTIALLGPEDHRAAFTSDDETVRRRLGSVGQVLPGIEVEVRDEAGAVLGTGQPGLVFLRGEQISGEYAGVTLLDDQGWFPTRDRGFVDQDGYLYIEGRADDTIIRGGENIAPAEIEDVLLHHPEVSDAVVVGVPDEEWGQRLVAVVVTEPGATVDADGLQELVRQHLRSSKTPDAVEFWPELPRTDTGKLLRRKVVEQLTG
jgi:acyl-CoA synthetase (AMP-forming)/AMP-acid ligase II